MAEKEEVVFREKAKKAICDVAIYISEEGYPDNAAKFAEKRILFGFSLANFPQKFPKCRYEQFSGRQLHCAVFEKYVFIYKVLNHQVIIYNNYL